MAAAGGPDGGQDIVFRNGDEIGVAFVTLEKRIREKFARDLAVRPSGEGVIALFCNVDVSPAMKVALARDALAKGYRLDVFDLERLRSLLDASLTRIRRQYLKIEDDIATAIRSRARKLLKFPDAFTDTFKPKTLLEAFFNDYAPARLFELLMEYDEKDVAEVPVVGFALHKHLVDYYGFRRECADVEQRLLQRIGDKAAVSRIPTQWRIQLRYSIMRSSGLSKEDVAQRGDFLNYGMTWEAAEQAHNTLSADKEFGRNLASVFDREQELRQAVDAIRALLDG